MAARSSGAAIASGRDHRPRKSGSGHPAHLFCCKRHSGFRESIIDDEQLGAAIAQGIRVFLDTPADVERYDHGTRSTGGQVALDVTILVEHEDRNAMAAVEGM